MPRKTKFVEITDENRDKGKIYLVTEMSAADAADWVTEVGMALMAAGIDLGEDIEKTGLPALIERGFRSFAGLHFTQAKTLLAKLDGCTQFVPDLKRNPGLARPIMAEGDIEEWTTILKLQWTAFDLIVGFSEPGADSTSASAPGNLAA